MVDLRAKPFYLNDEQIKRVEDAIANMTLEEKLGQLFVLLKGPAWRSLTATPISSRKLKQ